MKIKYRLACTEDVPTITALVARSIRALHSDSYEKDLIEEAIRHAYGVDWQLVRDQTYFVAEADGHIVGAGGWSYRRTLAGAHGPDAAPAPPLNPPIDAARVRAFYVDPAVARAGIGRALLEKSEAAAFKAGFRRAELTSTLPAVPFYASAGYREIEAYDLPLPSGAVLRLKLMSKVLPPGATGVSRGSGYGQEADVQPLATNSISGCD